jgi:hypothetical protein
MVRTTENNVQLNEKQMYKYSKLVFCIITLVALFFVAGCTSSFFKNWGRIEPDDNVTDSFNKFQINANFNYYITGSDVYPTSIMGLNKAYTLETDLWKQIDMMPELFSELVTNMRTQSIQCCYQTMHGFYIFDDKDNKIGVWYSLISGSIFIQMKEDSKVIIFPPRDDDSYRAYEGKSGRSGGFIGSGR